MQRLAESDPQRATVKKAENPPDVPIPRSVSNGAKDQITLLPRCAASLRSALGARNPCTANTSRAYSSARLERNPDNTPNLSGVLTREDPVQRGAKQAERCSVQFLTTGRDRLFSTSEPRLMSMTGQHAALIAVDPEVVGGQAHVRGTRIPVSVVLDCLAAGLSEVEIQRQYPSLTVEGIRAAAAYGASLAREEVIPLPA